MTESTFSSQHNRLHDDRLHLVINQALSRTGCPIPAELSERFAAHLDAKNRPYIFSIALIGSAAFWLFMLADFIIIRDMIWQSLLLRSLFAVFALGLARMLVRRITNIYWLEGLIPLLVHVAVPIWLYLLSNSSSAEVPIFAYSSVIFVLLLNIGVSARFTTAMVSSITLSGMLFYAVWLLNDGDWSALFVYTLAYIPVMVFSLIISWYSTFNGRRLFLYGLIDELNTTELKAANQRLWTQSHTDELTGLPNRTLLADRLEQALSLARRRDASVALLFVDLDKFKPVNDTHGHAAGDQLLRSAASRMSDTVRASDTVARFGGDEFIIVLPDVNSAAEAEQVADKIMAAIRVPFSINNDTLALGCSIGIALYPDHASTTESLHQMADRALYQAKSQGRDRSAVASDALISRAGEQ